MERLCRKQNVRRPKNPPLPPLCHPRMACPYALAGRAFCSSLCRKSLWKEEQQCGGARTVTTSPSPRDLRLAPFATPENKFLLAVVLVLLQVESKRRNVKLQNTVSTLWELWRKTKPFCYKARYARNISLQQEKNKKSILISWGAGNSTGDIRAVTWWNIYDELELDTRWEEKQRCSLYFPLQIRLALWCPIMYSNNFNFATICEQTDVYSRLQFHVRMLLSGLRTSDRFPVEKLITARSEAGNIQLLLYAVKITAQSIGDNAPTFTMGAAATLRCFYGEERIPP